MDTTRHYPDPPRNVLSSLQFLELITAEALHLRSPHTITLSLRELSCLGFQSLGQQKERGRWRGL